MKGLCNGTSDVMDKKNVDISAKKPSFFEIFTVQCNESDLGTISLNWFEELSSEAPLYNSKGPEEPEHKTSDLESTFKTPKRNLSVNSQFASTPMIFKEPNKTVPFVSPIKELDQSKAEAVLNGSLLHTPKIFEIQTPKCISESLGAEADPDMTWSSSLATPPTLSPTVIIARGNDLVSGTKQHNERIEMVMHSLVSKYGRSPKKKSVNVQSTSRMEDICAETDSKIHNFERLLDGSFGKSIFPSTLGGDQMLASALRDKDMHDGMESDLAVRFASSKAFLKKLKTVKQNKTCSDKVKLDEFQENGRTIKDLNNKPIAKYEKDLNSSKGDLQTIIIPNHRFQSQIPMQKHSEDQNSMHREEEIPSSLLCSWSQLDLSGLDMTQLEKVSSHYSGSSSTLHVKTCSEDRQIPVVKECASTKTLESCIQNTSSLRKGHKLLNTSCPEILPAAETSPVAVMSKKGPTLMKDSEAELASVISVSDSSPFQMENTTFSEVDNSCCHNFSRENCKISSDPALGSVSTQTAGDVRGLASSGLKSMASLSSLRRRPKKFIYVVNTPVNQEERTTQRDGSSACLEPTCADLKSCVSEVSETAIRNKGQKEDLACTKKHVIEEKQQIDSEKNCVLTNVFHEVQDNEKSSRECNFTDQLSILLQTDSKKETVMLPNIFANQGTGSSENKFCAIGHNINLCRKDGGECVNLTNFSSLQEAVLEESALGMQASKAGNKQAGLELATQHSLASGTQMTELGYQSKETAKLTIDESAKLTALEKKLDPGEPLPLDFTENVDSKQKLLGCERHSKTPNFGGFRTASNKQIALSDNNIRKGKLLFRNIEDAFFEGFSNKVMQNISNENAQGNAEISSLWRNKLNENPSNILHVSDSLVIQMNDAQIIFPECANSPFQNVLKNQHLEGKLNLTASQEAEVTELSNILEETGSQFEFTQFRKHKTVAYNNTGEVSGSYDKNDTCFDVWKDSNFEKSSGKKTQRGNDLSPNKHIGTTKESKIQIQSSEEATSINSASRKQNINFVPIISAPLQFSLSDVGGCSSAGGKEMSIYGDTIKKAEKLVSDVGGVNEMLSSHKKIFQSDCSNMPNKHWSNPDCMKEGGIDWHQRVKEVSAEYLMKNNAKDTITFVKENIESKSKSANYNGDNVVQVSSTTEVNLKIIKKYCFYMTRNELPSFENKQSILVSHHFENCGETQHNCNLQETLSDLTCLAEVAKTEKKSTLNSADEKENLILNQEEEKVNNPESSNFLQRVHTIADGNIFAGKSKVLHLLAGSCAREELENVSSSRVKTSARSKKGAISPVKKSIYLSEAESLFQSKEIPEIRKEKHIVAMGFHTASGKQIIVADESLAKARHLLSEEETIFPKKEEDVCNFVKPIIQVSKEKRNENITKVSKEGTEKHEYLHSKGNFEDLPDLLSDTSKQTEHPETIEEFSLEMTASESNLVSHTGRKEVYAVNEGLLGKNNLAYTSRKNIFKTISINSDIDQYLSDEGSGICAKQGFQHLSSRNASNVLINNKNLDSSDLTCNTTSKANTSAFKSEHSLLNHLPDTCHKINFLPETFTDISEETSSKNLIAENNSIFKETSKNESSMIHKCDLKLLNANSLQKYLSNEALASKLLKAGPVAFDTASGKTVGVSQEALKKVKQLFRKDCYKSLEENMEYQSKANKHDHLESCSDILGNRKFVASINCLGVENIPVENVVALQFSRPKEYCEDKEALQYTESMTLDTGPESCFQMNNKHSDTWSSSKHKCINSDFSTSNSVFFSTASGKPVQLSEESLKKAKLLFSEIEINLSDHQSHISDCDYSYEEASSAGNKETPKEKKSFVSQEKRHPNSQVNANIPCGFSTASGKQVQISQKALQDVVGFLKEFDDVSNNSCSVDQQSLGQDHISPIKALATETKVEDEVTSKSKPPEKNTAPYLTASKSNDKKISKNLLSTKIPVCMSHTEKYKQLAELEKSFPCSKEFEPLKTTWPCLSRMETKCATNLDTVTEENLDFHCSCCSQTPENYLEIEASESAKAFMEDDDLADSEGQKNKSLSSERTDNCMSYTRIGKRHMKEENTFGEPPIKRKLLPEFDLSEECNKSSLKASKSTPDGVMNDRKKFTYNIPLKPLICGPFSSTKERQEVLNPNLTTPDQDLKGSKLDRFEQRISKQPSSEPFRFFIQFSKTLTEESKKAENYHTGKKPVKVFVPPFKTKPNTSEDKRVNSKESVLRDIKSINGKEEVSSTKGYENAIDSENNHFENNNSTQISALNSEPRDTNSANLQRARNLQEIRIIKKQKQRIRPQPGSLYLVKASATPCRIPLKAVVGEKLPGSFVSEQLYALGISKQCIKINSRNAEDFQFIIQDFFSREYFLEQHGIQLADGGYLIPTDEGKAGKEEFYRALCDTPGVDPKLISKAWVYNHYRWIVWKLAAMEVAFPQEFADKCLTPERVLLQLKYRYDMEVDKSHRSAIKRITERDDVAAKTLILCISKIVSLNTNMLNICGDKSTAEDSKKDMAVVEVTDGWYGIKAVLDPPLQSLLYRKRLTVGQKIVVHGAELVGSQDASTPLEAPESLMLKISSNGTRRARWYAKLGYHRDPRPFSLPLASLLGNGGTVGCIDVVIQRVYPIQWMEKTAGSYVFRNCRAEEREAAKHAENRQKTLEALLANIQAEFEKNEDDGRRDKRVLRSRTLTRQQIRCLQDGAELYEAVLNAADPAYLEGYFNEEQLKALNSHRQMVNDKKQAFIEAEFRKAVESAEQEENSSCRRDVTTVIKLRIVDYRKQEREKEILLNIWRPSSHVCTLLREGGRYRILQLTASQSKGKSETNEIQLTATKKTQYLQVPVSQEILSQVYRPRECLQFSKLLESSFQPTCSEVDVVGYVVSLRKGTGFSTLMYLSDENHNLIAVQICTDLKQLAVNDIIIPSVLISATNLKWRPEFRSDIPTLFAGDLSAFSSNPKENHLQGMFNELKNTVENDVCFGKNVQCKLMNLLHTDGPQAFNLPNECGLDPFSWKPGAGKKHSIATPSSVLRIQSPLSLGKLDSKPSVPLDSEKITPELQETPKNCKKRKAMDLLSQVPSPPPVKPICTFISPSLKRAFQPPRSSGTQHERSLKRTECNVKKSAQKSFNETGFPSENNFVADEELAMINTQALLSNFSEERQSDSVAQTMYSGPSDSPVSLLVKNNSFQSTGKTNTFQDSTEAPMKETNGTSTSLAVQKKLQRKKK
ncbi:breast cancer type 2 susceptibility protein isoform X2 [Rhineura floridana]|uniref:breast cancer type 2 susceptibility protein isoform X2 n=1 Tax=Rhineura floridana TaxID=261503 RepID=UPI002AC876EB|nr:breast cancer type 2 susceptibility protein isoform X2 [Rhineura floridana]